MHQSDADYREIREQIDNSILVDEGNNSDLSVSAQLLLCDQVRLLTQEITRLRHTVEAAAVLRSADLYGLADPRQVSQKAAVDFMSSYLEGDKLDAGSHLEWATEEAEVRS